MPAWDSTPVSKVERPGKSPLEVARCQADGGLVTFSQDSLRRHAGHTMKQPVRLTEEEMKAILAGEIQ